MTAWNRPQPCEETHPVLVHHCPSEAYPGNRKYPEEEITGLGLVLVHISCGPYPILNLSFLFSPKPDQKVYYFIFSDFTVSRLTAKMSKTFTKEDVAAHGKDAAGLWIVIDEDVYDVTNFLDEHPGKSEYHDPGQLGVATRSVEWQQRCEMTGANDEFANRWKEDSPASCREGCLEAVLEVPQRGHSEEVPGPTADRFLEHEKGCCAGTGTQEDCAEAGTRCFVFLPSARVRRTAGSVWRVDPVCRPVLVSGCKFSSREAHFEGLADTSAGRLQYSSPYFNESHAALREEAREWIENELEPFVAEWEEGKEIPARIYKQMGERGYLAGLLGGRYPKEYTPYRVQSVPPERWDLFHEMLLTDELSRAGSGGLVWNLVGGFGIGCPPLTRFGKKELVDRILPGILAGDKRICLAITEPDAGSDVANLTCEAKLSEDGKHYIVNGEKKWITNGVWADYFTTAVRTGKPGMNGLSVLLIEREAGGVSTRRMDCQGVWSSGTTYVTFEDVKVPVENLIGKENQGFKGE